MAKVLISLSYVALYTGFMLLAHFVYFNFFRVDVVFYSSMKISIYTALGLGLGLLLWRLMRLQVFEKACLIIITLCLGYIFSISVPTVIDRSLSFYLLEKIDQRGGGIRADAFEEIFIKEYMIEHRLVDVRLTEQLESGTIELSEDGCVLLTPKGALFVRFSLYFRSNWLPSQRLLNGTYTDDLVDPFRNGSPDFDYDCK